MWQNIGYSLIGLGILFLIGWGVKDFFANGDIHILIRIAAGAIGLGVLILLGIAIRDRVNKKDNFKEVDN